MPTHILVLLMFLVPMVQGALNSDASQNGPKKYRALLPEAVARRSALAQVMPVYPEKAVQSGISGVVHAMLEISSDGEVLRVKVKPRTDPLLRNAVSDAIRQWQFKPWIGIDELPQGVITRLMFRFSLNDDRPRVEFYSPEPDTRIDECLECSNSAREMREWREWKEVPGEGANP